MFTNYWNFVSNLGIDYKKEDITQYKRKVLLNRILFILTLFNVFVLILQFILFVYPYIDIYFVEENHKISKSLYLQEFIYETLSTFFYLYLLYNNSKQNFDLSIKLYLFFFPIYVATVAISFGPKVDVHFIFLICYLQVFMFCGVDKKRLIIYSIGFTTLLFLTTIAAYHYFDYTSMDSLPERNYINIVSNIFVSVVFIYEFYKITESSESALIQERRKADTLLENILPQTAISELKEKGSVTPIFYSSASILFTDFKGFTKIAEKLSPKELITELDTCFSQFDLIIKRNNLEKLKTIGDSYMCAGGIPKENSAHAIDCVLAALEIQRLMNEIKTIKSELGFEYWELRLGIHTGPLIAGVIGEDKFAYDVWGDTVNTASRMESTSEVGEVNISESTYQLVNKYFNCEYRGEINAKNKGAIRMYFVKGIKAEYSVLSEGHVPNEEFLNKINSLRKVG